MLKVQPKSEIETAVLQYNRAVRNVPQKKPTKRLACIYL